jgi:hypothetical protein
LSSNQFSRVFDWWKVQLYDVWKRPSSRKNEKHQNPTPNAEDSQRCGTQKCNGNPTIKETTTYPTQSIITMDPDAVPLAVVKQQQPNYL